MAGAVFGDIDNHSVVFVFPTEGQIFNKMDTVNVTYTSPFSTPNLYLWCGSADVRNSTIFTQPAPGFNATVPITLSLTSDTPCWFNLRPGTVSGFGANSAAFNIISEERKGSRVTFGPESSAATATTLPSTTAPGPEGGNTASKTSAPVNENAVSSTAGSTPPISGDGLSAAAAAGIGTGVAAGILAVACGVFVLWRKRRHGRARDDREHGQETQGGWQDKKEAEVLARPYEYGSKRTFLAELSSAHAPPEIGSSGIIDTSHTLAAQCR
ncbi:hypothetical protein C8A01DRAFT_21295 [Parachaetomium inaequale]|uniref:Uncharacterized protein n=1 Tax=Parachaetomium inaequale TaxID=2588326 RepID=A0AAN6SL92_9PEZI|nr:hypothetical protein C8A01DRAFT_21295 [Parachaetomium inaequale]